MVRQKTKLEARGRSLLVNHGLNAPPRWWRKLQWEPLQKTLPEWLMEALEIYRPVLALLEEKIKALTLVIQQRVVKTQKALPTGLGQLTAGMVGGEIMDWNRFNNRGQVCSRPSARPFGLPAAGYLAPLGSSYTGLCPGEYSSGDKRQQGCVTKHGNPRLQAALVELGWRMVLFQPGYPPVKKRLSILCRGAKATGAQRKKAIVAVARQLAVDLWRLNTNRCTASDLGFTF